jgi:hypothetical protein
LLKAGFIGSDNLFDKYMCHWLQEHCDLRLIIWVDAMRWSAPPGRPRKVLERYRRRARTMGWPRVADEVLYYALYEATSRRRDSLRLREFLEARLPHGERSIDVGGVPQLRPARIDAPEVLDALRAAELDVVFVVCVDTMLPEEILSAPRLGAYLWHEGITPEYRGRYPAFWALANRDYDQLGYTLLRMTMELDGGPVVVQGQVRDVDPLADSPHFIAHKAIVDSLPESARFIEALERGEAPVLAPRDAVHGTYSYPTFSALVRILWDRRPRVLGRRRSREAADVRHRPGDAVEQEQGQQAGGARERQAEDPVRPGRQDGELTRDRDRGRNGCEAPPPAAGRDGNEPLLAPAEQHEVHRGDDPGRGRRADYAK